jgi:hypothetical protein
MGYLYVVHQGRRWVIYDSARPAQPASFALTCQAAVEQVERWWKA